MAEKSNINKQGKGEILKKLNGTMILLAVAAVLYGCGAEGGSEAIGSTAVTTAVPSAVLL